MGRKFMWTFPSVWVECVPPIPWIGTDECCRLILSESTVFLEMNETSEPESMSILSLWDVTVESYHANAVASNVACVDEFFSWVWSWEKMIAPLSYCWVEPCAELPCCLLFGPRDTYIMVWWLPLHVLHRYWDLQFFAECKPRQL